ncbi:hypothetical protein AXF42_Ash008944 [Apostasia shenzhenica]|uniref:Uncharacterized protein n=1 Tax=Apostasia shenzhenica TaxID=1088818 RepID=A0A2I0AT03_9ASPA|nr:hypothetical protein AXF42_Ash008944 [Apostasia shenzhenica]
MATGNYEISGPLKGLYCSYLLFSRHSDILIRSKYRLKPMGIREAYNLLNV